MIRAHGQIRGMARQRLTSFVWSSPQAAHHRFTLETRVARRSLALPGPCLPVAEDRRAGDHRRCDGSQGQAGAFVDARRLHSGITLPKRCIRPPAPRVASRPKVVNFTERAKERKRANVRVVMRYAC